MSKGSKPRPHNKDRFDKEFDRIFGKPTPRDEKEPDKAEREGEDHGRKRSQV